MGQKVHITVIVTRSSLWPALMAIVINIHNTIDDILAITYVANI